LLTDEESAAARVVLGVIDAAEIETALEEVDLAREIGQAGVTGIAQGAAVLEQRDLLTLVNEYTRLCSPREERTQAGNSKDVVSL